MNWKLYVDSRESRALDLCEKSMDEDAGDGRVYGDGDDNCYGTGYGAGWGDGYGYGDGNGCGNGWIEGGGGLSGGSGDGASASEWT